MSSPKITFVQVRLTPAMARALRAAGKAEARQLPAEIVQRLQASLGGRGITGEVERAMGELAARIGKLTGYTSDADRPELLALLQEAIPIALERWGADGSKLTADARAIARALAQGRDLGVRDGK